jgi:MarR family transcriptional regulator, organic hydroperoxide resistance regulator
MGSARLTYASPVDRDAREFGETLARVSRAVKADAGDAMRGLGLHPGQNFILDELWREDALTPGELARRIGIEVPTVTRTTQRMASAGLVERVPDDADARLVRVRLTARGRALRRELPPLLERVYRDALAPLSTDERRLLVDLLRRVAVSGDRRL